MAMDYKRAAKELGKTIIEPAGYRWEIEEGTGPHPKLWIICDDPEFKRFTLMSHTTNYDLGSAYRIKKNDVFAELRKFPRANRKAEPPPAPAPVAAPAPQPVAPSGPAPTKVYGVRIYRAGKGIGSLTLNIPKDVIKEIGREKVSLVDITDDGIMRVFFGLGQHANWIAPGDARGPDLVRYTFPRKSPTTTFKYGTAFEGFVQEFVVVPGQHHIQSRKPLPKEFFTDGAGQRKPGEYAVEDGTAAKDMLNGWLAWARKEGMDPVVTVNKDGGVEIAIAERKYRSL